MSEQLSSESSTATTESSSACDIFRLNTCNWESTIKNVFWKKIIEFRDKINVVLNQLLKIENDMKRIGVEANLHQNDIDKNMTSIASRKNAIENDTTIDEERRNELIQNILCEFEQNTITFSSAFECLKKEKCEKLQVANELFDQLFRLKEDLTKSHTENMEEIRRFQSQACKSLKTPILTKMSILRHNYEKVYSQIYQTEFELKILRKSVEETIKNAPVCSSSSSTSQSELPFISELHELRNIEFQKRHQNIAYIKKNLGKPIIEALSATRIYEPLDPLNFIANYLFYYRHNQLRIKKKRTKMEELLSKKGDCINETELPTMTERFCP